MALRDAILAIRSRPGARVWLALDFHGTNKDILYTPLADDRTFPPRFASQWVAAIQARFPDYEVESTSAHNATEWTFKRWAYETPARRASPMSSAAARRTRRSKRS